MNRGLELLASPWRERAAAAADWLGRRGIGGRVGLILGSGLGDFADGLDGAEAVAYADIPEWPATSVAGHRGRLVAGRAAGVPVVALQGRVHPYEGLPPPATLLPVAVLAGLGIEAAVLTNAAGGLNRFYRPGDLMVIRDHLDLHLGDPLRGLLAPGAEGSERAPAGVVYDEELARALAEAGAAAGVPLHAGTYASVWGPAYETRAEIGMLRRAGGDAVGMSTAPEAALLARLGVAVVGLSCITNPSRETGQPELSHDEVVEVGRRVRDRLTALLLAFLPRLAEARAGRTEG